MSQAFYPTNDGHIGNVAKLSTQELTDLIHRQTSLLKKRNFIQKLPDKGKKNQELLDKLNQELCRRKSSNPQTNTQVADSSTVKSEDGETERLFGEFDRLQVTDTEDSIANKSKHFFEIAEERSKQNENDLKKYIRLNQNIKAVHVEELPASVKSLQPPKNIVAKKVTVVPEESSAVTPCYKYSEAQTIPLDESLQLQTVQKEKVTKIQAIAAAQRLSLSFGIKMETYNPEGIDMSYRGATQDVDSDSDDNKNEDIYDEGDDVD